MPDQPRHRRTCLSEHVTQQEQQRAWYELTDVSRMLTQIKYYANIRAFVARNIRLFKSKSIKEISTPRTTLVIKSVVTATLMLVTLMIVTLMIVNYLLMLIRCQHNVAHLLW